MNSMEQVITKQMHLETRYYDNGIVLAKLWKSEPDLTGIKGGYDRCIEDGYDRHIETIEEGGDYSALEDWIEQLEIDLDDVVGLVLDLDAGKWMDITEYV